MVWEPILLPLTLAISFSYRLRKLEHEYIVQFKIIGEGKKEI